jgi:hypothetical protein
MSGGGGLGRVMQVESAWGGRVQWRWQEEEEDGGGPNERAPTHEES